MRAKEFGDLNKVVLELSQVSKTYKNGAIVEAVRGVSLFVRKGETLGLIGESGCGKTTLGHIAARVIAADSGSVMWNGGSDAANRAGDGIQLVFQEPGASLNPARRIGWTCHEALRARGVREKAERGKLIADLLPNAGLGEDCLTRYPHEMSSGQRQRIAVMVALLMKPRLIVADEVVSSLDVSVRAQILNLLCGLQKKYSVSYLFISHEIDVVCYMSHRIAVMYRGEIVEELEAEAAYENAAHPYTISLLRRDLPGSPKPEESLAAPVFTNSLNNLDNGVCEFFARCPKRTATCVRSHPSLFEIAPGHTVRCHRVSHP